MIFGSCETSRFTRGISKTGKGVVVVGGIVVDITGGGNARVCAVQINV